MAAPAAQTARRFVGQLADGDAVDEVYLVADKQSDKQGKRGDYFEIQKSFAADAADFLHVFHAGNPGYQGAEDDQRDDHGDQANKRIAKRFHGYGRRRAEIAEDDRNSHTKQHLERQASVEGLFARRRDSRGWGSTRNQHRSVLLKRRAEFADIAQRLQ